MTDAPGRIFTQCPSKHCAALGTRPEQPAHGNASEARGCTGYTSRSIFRLSPLPKAGSSGAKIQVTNSTVLASSQCCCRLVHAKRAATITAGQAAAHTAGQEAAERRATAVTCSNSSCSSVGKRRARSRCKQVPSASRSSSNGELQAAAAASGDRQQQRRAALCKIANQA